MTKRRIYGEDKPMMAWVRDHPELPSYSMNHGRSVNDVDFLIHQYMTTVDSSGTRELQFMMHIETKTRNGIPDESQKDTLHKEHVMKKGTKWITNKRGRQQVRHHGVSILSMSGECPSTSNTISWGRFGDSESCEITFSQISEEQLLDLLTFQRDPDTFARIDFRRHHKTSRITKVEREPLGFEIAVVKTLRS